MKKIFLACLLFSVTSLQLDASSSMFDWLTNGGGKKFTCDSNSYLFTSAQTASETGVFNISMKNAKVNFIKTFAKSHINATGYNVKDDYIYGWEYGEGSNYSTYDPHLVMIDADFNVKRVKLSGTLPKTRFYLGDVDKNGIFYLANRHQPYNNNLLQEIQRVDLNIKKVLSKLTLDYSSGARYIVASDFAVNPIDNQLYTVNSKNNKLVRINTSTGKVKELGYVGNIGNTYSVINFFDKDGNFYFYTSDSEKIYKIDISNPNSINTLAKAFTKKLTGMVNSGDGARCANASISLPVTPTTDNNICQNSVSNEKLLISKYTSGNIVSLNWDSKTSTGNGESVLNSGEYGFLDISYDSTGRLFGIDHNSHLIELDPNTGAFISDKGPIAGSTPYGSGSYPAVALLGDDQGYLYTGVSKNNRRAIVKFKPDNTNITELVAYTDRINDGGHGGDLAWSGGFLYQTIYNTQDRTINLVKIDPNTGNIIYNKTIKDSRGNTFSTNVIPMYSDSTGTLFVIKYLNIYKVDPSNVVATYVDSYSNNESGPTGATTTHEPCASQKSVAELIVDYHFDECSWNGTTGEVKDSSANGKNATAKLSVNTQSDGSINRSGQFLGNNYITVDDGLDDVFGNTNEKFTITAWIKPSVLTSSSTNHGTKNTFIAKASDTHNDNLEIGVNINGSIHLYLDTINRNKTANFGSGITTDSWHFVAISYDGNSVNVNIDGNNYENSTTWSGGGAIKNAIGSPLSIGASLHKDNFFNGGIDEVKIFKNALSKTEITTIYNNEKSGKNADGTARDAVNCASDITVIADYHFDECSWNGTIGEVKDSSGNGFDGVAINSANSNTSDGKVNGSGKFLGDYDAVRVNGITGVDSNNFTLSFWTKIIADGSSTHELIKLENVNAQNSRNGNSGVVELRYRESDDELRVSGERKQSDGSVNGYSQTVTANLNDGKWHHIVLTYKDQNMKIFVDTSDADMIHPTNGVSGISNLGILDDFNGVLRIGNSINGIFSTKAQIDEVKLYSGALDTNAISTLHANEKIGKNADGTVRDAINCAKAFSCQSESFVSFNTDRYATSGDSKYNTISLVDGKLKAEEVVTGVNGVNSIGYNVKDNMVWGYNLAANKVVRIDADKKATLYDISGLDSRFYVAADVDSNGVLYLFSRESKTERQHLARVDLNTMNVLPEVLLVYEEAPTIAKEINTADFAFNPKDGKLYFIQNNTDTLYSISFTSDGSKGIVHKEGSLYLGAISPIINFFDKDGNFYFNKNSTTMYRVNVASSSEAVWFSDLDKSLRNGDGARCANAPIANKPIITITDSSVVEGDSGIKDIVFTITSDRDIEYAEGLKLSYTLSDGSAKVGSDYKTFSGSFFMKSRIYKLTIPVIIGDTEVEGDEDFYIKFTAPIEKEGAIFSKDTAKGTIIDNDKIVFNAMTTNSGKITTQIVNNPFDITIKAYVKNNVQKDVNITEVSVIKENGTIVKTWRGLKKTDINGVTNIELNVDKATKIAKINIKGNYLGKSIENNSTDLFAIRPDRFILNIPQKNSAAENFTISAKALDIDGNQTEAYNEIIDNSFTINYAEKLPNCDTATLDLSGIHFTNGEFSKDVNYSEVGELDFNISEIDGHEFASIDRDDTLPSQRFITAANISNREFVAGELKVSNWILEDGSNGFTYYADADNLDQMGAKLKVAIRAVNKDGAVTKNYRSGCYAKHTDIHIKYNVKGTDTQVNTLIWQDSKESSHGHIELSFIGNLNDGDFVFDVNSTKFNNGETNETIYINFDRNKKIAKDPIRFTVFDIVATNGDANGAFSKIASVDFYYGRLNRPDYYGKEKGVDVKIFYELYASKYVNKNVFTYVAGKESEDSVNWYIIEPSVYNDGVSGFGGFGSANNDFDVDDGNSPCSIISSITNTVKINRVDQIKFNIKKLPFRDRITYEPKPWLVYNRFNDMATKHSFNMLISSSADKWSGRGKQGQSIDSKVSGKSMQKMDW